jgi:nucleoid-associated protein YgaU
MTTISSARFRALSIISITVIVVLLLLASASQATGEVTATVSYRVHPGDTLWSIAQTFGPDGQDVRSVIATIERMNDLDGGMLQAGQLLELPDTEG